MPLFMGNKMRAFMSDDRKEMMQFAHAVYMVY